MISREVRGEEKSLVGLRRLENQSIVMGRHDLEGTEATHANRPCLSPLGRCPLSAGVLHLEPSFSGKAATLAHRLEPRTRLTVRKFDQTQMCLKAKSILLSNPRELLDLVIYQDQSGKLPVWGKSKSGKLSIFKIIKKQHFYIPTMGTVLFYSLCFKMEDTGAVR